MQTQTLTDNSVAAATEPVLDDIDYAGLDLPSEAEYRAYGLAERRDTLIRYRIAYIVAAAAWLASGYYVGSAGWTSPVPAILLALTTVGVVAMGIIELNQALIVRAYSKRHGLAPSEDLRA